MKDINLMNDENTMGAIQKLEEVKKPPAGGRVTAILVLILALMILVVPAVYMRNVDVKTAEIQKDLESNRYSEIISLNRQIESVNQTLENRRNIIRFMESDREQVSNILTGLQEAAPRGILLEGIQYIDKNLTINGAAKDSRTVAEYLSNLSRLSDYNGYTSTATIGYGQSNGPLKFNLKIKQSERGDKG